MSIRTFDTGATRNSDIDPATGEPKLDYAGFFCPLVLQERARYMNRHRLLEDGSLRPSDNWKRSIPSDVCLSSLLRHVVEVWEIMDNRKRISTTCASDEVVDEYAMREHLCAIMFNCEAMLRNELLGG